MKTHNAILAMTIAIFIASCSKAPARRAGDGGGGANSDVIPVGVDTDGDKIPDIAAPVTALSYTTALPRITHVQWENSVKDILLLSAVPGLAGTFTTDPSGSFFRSDGNLLKVTPALWNDYQTAAETVASRVTADAAQIAKLIPEGTPASGEARAKAIIAPIAKRAFRRPVTDSQLARLVALYNKGPSVTGVKDATAAGLRLVITAILQSPNFMYRTELGKGSVGLTSLSPYEVASRLSFAAWNTIPDEALLKAAESGEILTEEGLKTQVKRLVDDSRADAVLLDFYERLFDVASFVDTKKDAKTLGYWPDDMGKTLVKEAELFIRETVVKEKGGITQILTSPYAFVNSKTAPIYGVEAPAGDTFEKVELDPSQRAGLLTQIGFLARRSKETESDPIHRGVVVATNVLCADLSAPPGTFPPLPAELPGKTTRDRVEAHTGKGTCGSSCHGMVINPAGYAFENYDAAGKWRTMDNNLPVDSAAEFGFSASNIKFDGAVEFMKKITEREEMHRCYVKKAIELMYARQVDVQDESLIQVMANKSYKNLSTRELFYELLIDSRVSKRGNPKGE